MTILLYLAGRACTLDGLGTLQLTLFFFLFFFLFFPFRSITDLHAASEYTNPTQLISPSGNSQFFARQVSVFLYIFRAHSHHTLILFLYLMGLWNEFFLPGVFS